MSTASPQSNELTSQSLRIVRLAFVGGPVLTAVILGVILRGMEPILSADPGTAGLLNLVFTCTAVAATFAVLFVRRARLQADAFERQASLCIMGWGIGELPAMFGAVLLLLTGSLVPFLIGLLVVGVALLLLPVPVRE